MYQLETSPIQQALEKIRRSCWRSVVQRCSKQTPSKWDDNVFDTAATVQGVLPHSWLTLNSVVLREVLILLVKSRCSFVTSRRVTWFQPIPENDAWNLKRAHYHQRILKVKMEHNITRKQDQKLPANACCSYPLSTYWSKNILSRAISAPCGRHSSLQDPQMWLVYPQFFLAKPLPSGYLT